MPDLIEAITDDHEALATLLDRVEGLGRSGPSPEHREALDEHLAETRRHSTAERSVALPAMVPRRGGGPERAAAGDDFHDAVEDVVSRLETSSSDDPGHFATVTELLELLREHLGTADDELVPALREALADDERETLGETYAEVRENALA
ncbi:MAG TPA: hemerythrin domain-containing protein [Acidimicrobiia bacterium]|nr:hemerythrin domain-containing protein [Acidimicrobiia bacterium]